jgi:gentisate 1,2-dioxygenase
LLPAGFVTRPRLATDGTIYVVVEGTGTVRVDGKDIQLAPRDTIVIPSWRETVFRADEDLVLFGYSDRTAQEKLGLFRESLG